MTSLIDKFADATVDAILNATGGIEKHQGKYAEWQARNELRFTKLLGKKGKILKNLYVPKDLSPYSAEGKEGVDYSEVETTEIDNLFITQKGIFVLEIKNYGGWIFGNEKDRYWTETFPNGKKVRFFNPVLQNRGHIKHLSNYLQSEDDSSTIPFYSIISFLDNKSELKKVTVTSPDVWVIRSDRIYATIRDIWEQTPDTLSQKQVDGLYVRLKQLTNANKETRGKHIANIKEKKEVPQKSQPKQTPIDEMNETPAAMICPRCGGNLVLRTARKGKSVGSQFYGCDNFPKCRYTKAL